jgi:hypothetical protein
MLDAGGVAGERSVHLQSAVKRRPAPIPGSRQTAAVPRRQVHGAEVISLPMTNLILCGSSRGRPVQKYDLSAF